MKRYFTGIHLRRFWCWAGLRGILFSIATLLLTASFTSKEGFGGTSSRAKVDTTIRAKLVGSCVTISGRKDSNSGGVQLDNGTTTITDIKISDLVRKSIFAKNAKRKTLVLRIEGVQIPTERPLTIRAFLNTPKAGPDTPTDSPGYLSTFTLVPLSRDITVNGKNKINVTLDVTRQIRSAIKSGEQLSVTLVPIIDGKDKSTRVHIKTGAASIIFPD